MDGAAVGAGRTAECNRLMGRPEPRPPDQEWCQGPELTSSTAMMRSVMVWWRSRRDGVVMVGADLEMKAECAGWLPRRCGKKAKEERERRSASESAERTCF